MATREDLELAFLNAYSAGDREGAEILLREIKKLEAAQSPRGQIMDVVKSAAAGVSGTLYPLMVGGLAAKVGIAPQKIVEPVKEAVGANYTPQTSVGGYAKNMAAGAVPLMGRLGVASGVAGGALARFAEEHGYNDPLSQIAAWMAPSLLQGAGRAIRTGTPFRDIRKTLEALTPQEYGAMQATLNEAQKRGVPMSVWQAAPEGSSLNVVGEAAARRSGADEIQSVLRAQTPMANQAWVRSQTEKAFDQITPRELSFGTIHKIADAIRAVGRERHLDPTSAKDIERAVGLFLSKRQMTLGELKDQLAKASLRAPDSLETLKLMALVDAVSKKKAPPPTVIEPQVKTIGEVISAKGRIEGALDEFASMDQATKGKIREAIDKVLTEVEPGYAQALKEYGTTKKIAEILAKGQALKGKHLVQHPEKEARLTLEATIPYAIATNPWWASVPIVRHLAGKDIVDVVDKALASGDFRTLQELARKNPQIEGLLIPLLQAMRGTGTMPAINAEQAIREYLPTSR